MAVSVAAVIAKALHVQAAGALAMVVVNYADELVRLGSYADAQASDVTIPSLLVEQADGNAGSGMLYINNTAVEPNTIEHYRIDGELGYVWKSYGPFCAYEGWHNFSYTSDANPDETSFTITDSFGLIKAKGGMDAFPVRFHTLLPSKFCTPDGGLSALQLKQRNRKLIAANDQFTPRERLIASGFGVPRRGAQGQLVFDPQDSPIVCFVSRQTQVRETDAGRTVTGHSLVQTSEFSYELPPLATVCRRLWQSASAPVLRFSW